MSFDYHNSLSPKVPFKLKAFPVFFRDESCLEAIVAVIDEKGSIKNFPGIIWDERWIKEQKLIIEEEVAFEAKFYPLENERYLMLWLVQPSGTYWMDKDGFGIEDDLSIELYSIVNKHGVFEKTFELYSIDWKPYCHDFDRYVD